MRLNGHFVTAKEVCERYGICDDTLRNWLKDSAIHFPKPVRIKRQRFFNKDHLDKFDDRLAGKTGEP